MNKILDVKESVTTPVTTLTSAKDIGAYTGGVDYDDQSSPYDIQINEEKVKQEKEKTKQQQIKTDKEIDKDTGKFSGSPAATQGGSFSDKDTGKFSGSPSSGTSLGSSVHGTGSYNKPTSKPKTDLAEPLPVFPLIEIIIQGLSYLSLILDAAIPIIPS